ncbi:MAG: lysophospholipid acyltransferase family protein [Acidobacteriota bacterium]
MESRTEAPIVPAWQRSWLKRTQAGLIGALGYPLLAALGSTYRFRVDGLEHLTAASALGPPIHAFWHGRILPGTIYFKNRGIVVITSDNFDGEWIARIITRFGYRTARGSSSRGSRKALRQMIRDAKTTPVAFTLDGPRGPARVAQPGAAWLARTTGNPIIPFHLEASRRWTLGSWDGSQIPKPFATVALAFAPPIRISSQADAQEIEQSCRTLERVLGECETRCGRLLAAPGKAAT